jgi:hypothetical protein
MSVGRISRTAAAEVAAAAAEEDVEGSGEAGEAGKQEAADLASTSANFSLLFFLLSFVFLKFHCLVSSL